MMHAEADSTSAVPHSSKICVRRAKATASEMRSSTETSTTTTAAARVTSATKSTTTTTVRSSPRYGAQRHGCDANQAK